MQLIENPVVSGLPSFDADEVIWNMAEPWRREYVSAKYTAAAAVHPKRICEIGVYSGIAAMCFLAACPDAEYVGIDNLSAEAGRGMEIVRGTGDTLTRLGYRNSIIIGDSQQMQSLPGQFDLVHVDGDHRRAGAKHDVVMAWNALNPHGAIVVDNGHSPEVCGGTFDAMHEVLEGRLFRWAYLGELVGSILIWRD